MTHSYEVALRNVKRSPKGIPWAIPAYWATEIIKDFDLKLECRNGDMTGEASALFRFQKTTFRLKRDWMKRWYLYNGDWEPDPHWTGD